MYPAKKKKSVGVLYPNQKTKERSPDMTGKIQIQYADLKQLAQQIEEADDTASGNVALWFYPGDPDNGKGPCVSLQLTPPYRPRQQLSDSEPETAFKEFFEEVHKDTDDDGS